MNPSPAIQVHLQCTLLFVFHDAALSFETLQVSDLAGDKSWEMCVSPAEYKSQVLIGNTFVSRFYILSVRGGGRDLFQSKLHHTAG